MGSENGKVHRLESVKSDESAQMSDSGQNASLQSGVTEAHRDMSKVAMIVSLLAVLLLVIFFYGMNRNIAGLTDEVKSLGTLRDEVSSLDQRVVQMGEDMPVQMKRILVHDVVNEMAMKASYLSETLADEGQRASMKIVLKELQGVRAELEK
jgi:hypothetical protein